MSTRQRHDTSAFLTTIAVTITVTISIAGCANNSPTSTAAGPTSQESPVTTSPAPPSETIPNGIWKNASQATAEFRQATQSLQLAPGWRWNAHPEPATGPDGKPQYYQRGAATNDAQLYWFCSWAVQEATAKPGSPSARTALLELESVRAKVLYQQGLTDSSRAVFDQLLTGAEHGSLDKVRQYVSANCGSSA